MDGKSYRPLAACLLSRTARVALRPIAKSLHLDFLPFFCATSLTTYLPEDCDAVAPIEHGLAPYM